MSVSQIERFSSCNRGAVAIVFALLLSVLFLFIGLAIDMSRAMHVRQIVQDGLDAATLAAAKQFQEPGTTEADVELAAEKFFFAGFRDDAPYRATLSNFRARAVRSTGSVSANVDIDLPTTFTKAGGSIASLEMRPRAVSSYTETKLEVVLVLDVTGSMNNPAPDGYIKLETMKRAAKDFTDAMYVGTTKPGFIRLAIVPYAASVNAGSYATAVAGLGTDACVVERPGVEAYTDAAPDGLNRLGRTSALAEPLYSCPGAAVVPLTDLFSAGARAAFKSNIDTLTGAGNTAGHLGAAWGWYVLSNRWSGIFGAQAGSGAGNIRKVIVFLTDGDFNIAYRNGGGSLTDPDRTDPLIAGSSPNQALRLCDNMRAEGVAVYTIGFATSPAIETTLKACSGEENFYDASNSSQLLDAFRAIATKLTSLRLTG